MSAGPKPSIPAPVGHYGCPRCRKVKPLSEFWKTKAGPGGHGVYCKKCVIERRAVKRAEQAGKPDPGIEARYWPKVDKNGPNGCWNWTGIINRTGYGLVWFQSRYIVAHRVAIYLDGRDIPKEHYPLVVHHKCHNTRCVNPAHLEVVTDYKNRGELAHRPSPSHVNAAKTHCGKCHKPLAGKNLAIRRQRPGGRPSYLTRICLTCRPHHWRLCVEPIEKPGSKLKWLGPHT